MAVGHSDDVDLDLPGGSFNGLPTIVKCFPFPFPVTILPHDLDTLGEHGNVLHSHAGSTAPTPASVAADQANPKYGKQAQSAAVTPHEDAGDPVPTLIAKHGDLLLEFDPQFTSVARLCLPFYRQPPAKGRYLQLFHNLGDATMCINGRKYLGNTPTLIAGVRTRMRFGLVGMGNVDGFHTFHLHGHRWIVPGPDGDTLGAIQGSAQVTAVSQFEDTRTFGPANSFTFKVNQGSFMGSFFTPDPTQAPGLGEWRATASLARRGFGRPSIPLHSP